MVVLFWCYIVRNTRVLLCKRRLQRIESMRATRKEKEEEDVATDAVNAKKTTGEMENLYWKVHQVRKIKTVRRKFFLHMSRLAAVCFYPNPSRLQG